MNRFIQAVTSLDIATVRALLAQDPKWRNWSEPSGKDALHYLCGLKASEDPQRAEAQMQLLDLLLDSGLDIDSIHHIPDGGDLFPATPLWYAYTRGSNERLYTNLLERGADPQHCMFAIAWNDDIPAASLFLRHGARIDDVSDSSTPFLAAYLWRRYAVAAWFLQNGSNVDFADAAGNTALFYAVKRKYKPEHVQLLLRFGADCDRANNAGLSPRKLAALNHQRQILRLCSQGGAWPEPAAGRALRDSTGSPCLSNAGS